MSGTETTNLRLFKTNMATDGNDSFDFDRDLNQNWDKIDEYTETVSSNLDTKSDKSYVDYTLNRIYDGVNLAEKFADEIANYSNVYEWLKARINNGNYAGIHVGDYIFVQMRAGTVAGEAVGAQTFKCRIVGIDTYTGCGDTIIGHHIDFNSDEVVDREVVWNPTDNNNGTSVNPQPWLASKVYAWLNGLNNYNTANAYNKQAHGVNATNQGVLQLLPTELTNLIVNKRMLLDERYSASGLLTGGTTWAWHDMGKLWLPDEMEVYGTQVRSNLCQTTGWWNPENHVGVAYPYYLGSGRNRIKKMSNGSRSHWWLSSVASLYTAIVCIVNGHGGADSDTATYAGIRCPLCFRL